jgi:subtilase family serine protease
MIVMPLSFSSALFRVAFRRVRSIEWKRIGLAAACGVFAIRLCGAWSLAGAQSAGMPGPAAEAPQILITQPVDELQRIVLKGNTHPLARREFDRGAAPASQPMRRMILVLQRSAGQESALRALLDAQQVKASPQYHQWLTPEQFGRSFGIADSDVETVKAWLESHGFEIASVSKGRTTIEFSGTAGQVQEAFRTTIHKYVVNGEEHWANTSDPSIPSALAPVVKGVLTLHNFPRQTNSTVQGHRVAASQGLPAPLPMFTFTQGKNIFYGLGPTDFATIYNVLPLWKAGIDGTGQTIAIVGETNIHLSDIETFRSLFGLPAKDPQIILNGPDPGVVGDEPEAVLDVSWSGAVAKNASIDLVVSATTEASLGVDLSALYIVDNDLAPVMSESYGECESGLGNAGNAFYNSLWQQAAAEGITVIVSAGDGGSAGCDDFNTEPFAYYGLAVSGFASTPYNVSVGGSDFDQTALTSANYWNSTNDPTTKASAKGYIPETTWNQSCAGIGPGACTGNSNYLDIVGGSGGPSNCSTMDSNGNCVSGYGKPAWQTGTGVPSDGVRDQPDVSLFASAGFNGSFYIICEEDANGFFGTPAPCSLTADTFVGLGGTSASAPTFAGMMALVNQSQSGQGLGTRQGNANYVLYKLAAQNGASCNSTTAAATGNSCIFYDITKGNNSVPCLAGTPNCGTAVANGYGVLTDPNNPNNPAWTTTTGYDLATGLGTLNANNLVSAWSAATYSGSTTTLTSLSPASLVHGEAVSVSATVAAQSGSGTPTGSVALMAAPAGKIAGVDDFVLNHGVASGTTTLLPGGTYNVTAHYPGDSNFGASDSAPVQVTVGKENSQTKATLMAYPSASNGFYSTNTIPYGSIFFLRSDVSGTTGTACAPNPQQTQVPCPTGNVSFTNNGNVLDAGSYALNSQGYTEDQSLAAEFTSISSYSLLAQYGGDSSYNSSSATLTATVTQGPTFPQLEIYNLPYYNQSPGGYLADSGQEFEVLVPVYTQSILQAPTGTISIQANGTPAPGTISYNPRNGSFSASSGTYSIAYLAATLTTSIDTPGNYTFTTSYSGDADYLGSQGAYSVPVTVVDTTFNITPPIANVTVAAGQTGTTSISLASVDNFFGLVNITCALPKAMLEATCPAINVNLNSASAAGQIAISTTAAHPLGAHVASGRGIYGLGALACVFLFAIPGRRRRWFPLALLVLACIAGSGGCGGGGGGSTIATDPGTPAGTYTVNVTATSLSITRTGSFNVTVQ